MNPDRTLHITNGHSLTAYLKELDFKGIILSWQEMLCEGPTLVNINSRSFFEERKAFLIDTYDIEIDEYELLEELNKLDKVESYDQIVIWFEFDLFCQINMLGVINLILQKEIDKPIYLVTSGRVKGHSDLKGLAELEPDHLFEHFDNRIELGEKDLELARTLWHIYCGTDHNLFKPFIVEKSNFEYMGNCLRAHLERFPDAKNGLTAIDRNIFEILKTKKVKSKHHLLGYTMNFQGFYGYGDLQMSRIIDSLEPFIYEVDGLLKLNREGHEVLMNRRNLMANVDDDMIYGGVKKKDYLFSQGINKLIKPIVNAN